MSRLAGEKYLEQVNRRGFFVKRYTPSDLEEMFEVRAGLEGIAIRLCTERGSDEDLERLAGCFDGFELPVPEDQFESYLEADKCFHTSIIEIAANSMIGEMAASFGYMMKSYQPGLVRFPEETLPEHQAMIRAIRSRDGVHAQELMIQHHTKTARKLARLAEAEASEA